MEKVCGFSGEKFFISGIEKEFCEKLGVDLPKLSPVERLRRRMAFRNERNLYKRKCNLCGVGMVSIYSENYVGPVYCQKCWWSDDWEGRQWGREFDFERPFFDQMKELLFSVPRVSLYNIMADNSQYCNFCMGNKDCYLVFGSDKNQGCMYSHWIYQCKDVVDSAYCYESEILYEAVDCMKCYQCFWTQECVGCSDCWLGCELRRCRNCFGCVGLEGQEFCVFNEQLNEEEFGEFMGEFRKKLAAGEDLGFYWRKFEELKKSMKRRGAYIVNSENCEGDFIFNSENVVRSRDVRNGRDLMCCNDIFDMAKDCVDCSYSGEIELCYEGYEVHGFNLQFCNRVWPCSDSQYLDNCDNCQDCFGCVGLKRKQYCILNKQYSKEEYDVLKGEIIDHMKKTGEWGEFFPIRISPFSYNETVAKMYFPLTKAEVLKNGWSWFEEDDKGKSLAGYTLPLAISEVGDDVLEEVLVCEKSGRQYRINKQELDFYRRFGIGMPRTHHDLRHERRMMERRVSF